MWRRWTRHWRLHRQCRKRPTSPTEAAVSASLDEKKPRECEMKPPRPSSMAMPKKPSPTKTRTGNALAQFVIVSALTVVAYQFVTARLYTSSSIVSTSTPPLAAMGGSDSHSPSPWTDAALEKYRAKQRASDREVISTTEFSCFMACIGLFGLMQHKKKKSEEEAIEAQRRALEMRILRSRDGGDAGMLKRTTSDGAVVSVDSSLQSLTSTWDTLAALPGDVQLELLAFLSAEELVECAMVNRAWHVATGDSSHQLWKNLFARDYGESGERFAGIVPRICWRQYYFLHRVSRAVELARWLDNVDQRKCVVIQGHVYDVTRFLDAHPGGYHVIGDVLGTDATELWDQFQHSAEAKELMKEFIVEDALLTAWAQSRDETTGHVLPQKNLAVVETRWRQISWYLNHAHLLGGLSSTFLDVGFRVVVWRTTTTKPKQPRM